MEWVVEPAEAVTVTVLDCDFFLVPLEPQPLSATSASATTSTESAVKYRRYLRVRARTSRPIPKLQSVSGTAGLIRSVLLCALSVPDMDIEVVTAAPVGVTVEGLKLHDNPVGRPEQVKLTALLNPLVGVTVSVDVAGAELLSVPLAGLMESEKSGPGAEMATLTAFDVEALKLLSPAYWAVMEWLPIASEEVERVAIPLELRLCMPRVVVPSRKVTEPVGTAVPEAGVTATDRAMEEPATALLSEAVSAVLVLMGAEAPVTVTVIAAEVLAA